jgi:hypothetical protein
VRAPVVPSVEPCCNQQPQVLSLCSESNLADHVISGFADRAIRYKARQLAGRHGFSLSEREALEQELASLNERLQNELHHLKINGIEDEYTREWQSIQATYDEKVRAAEKAGADIELIEMARRERLAQLDRKQDQKAAEEEKRWQADVGRSAEQMQDEIDRLTIENNKELTAEEKAKQLMELRQAHEIRGLREAGVDTDENMRLLREKHALEAGQLLMAQNVPAAMRQTVAGTFNATMVGRMGGGNYAERTARATEKTAKNTEELLKKPAPALAFG